MTRDEALKILSKVSEGTCIDKSYAERFLEGYEQGVRDSAELLKNYWPLLQRFYDADKQMLPRWNNKMFEEQEKVRKALALLDVKEKKG